MTTLPLSSALMVASLFATGSLATPGYFRLLLLLGPGFVLGAGGGGGRSSENPDRDYALFAVFVGLQRSGSVSLVPVLVADVSGGEGPAVQDRAREPASWASAFSPARAPSLYAIVSGGDDWSVAVLFSRLLIVAGGLMLTRTVKVSAVQMSESKMSRIITIHIEM